VNEETHKSSRYRITNSLRAKAEAIYYSRLTCKQFN